MKDILALNKIQHIFIAAVLEPDVQGVGEG